MDDVDSTSDERTVNNTVRHKYRVLSDDEKRQMSALKDAGGSFIDLCDDILQSNASNGKYNSREMSIAKTKIEEAVMWAVKHVTA